MSANKGMADMKVDSAREKVREWGARVKRGQSWDDQSWHLLGHALQYAHEAIEIDPTYQRPWNLLTDVYHRIGKDELAKQCLTKAYSLATPGPNHPGRFYREVENNLKTKYPFDTYGGLNRELPPLWFQEKYRRYWVTTEVALAKKYMSPAVVPTVLISYARENMQEAERLRTSLIEKGFAVWKDTHDILPGEQWEKMIKEAFQKSDFVMLCFSKIAVSKIGFFQVEVKEALYWQKYRPDGQAYLIPARIEDCELPSDILPFHWVDLFPEWSQGIEKIAATITRYRKP